MNYDFIEVGTSDWDTLIESTTNQIGISVEPLKYYLDRLPINPSVIKVNAALSILKGSAKIYWVDHQDIIEYNLPWFLKGCNSLYNPHSVTLKELQDRNLENLMKNMEIEVLDWKTLVERYDVKQVKLLKIDCEGHDFVIVNSIMNTPNTVLPLEIQFEANELTSSENRENTINLALSKGYELIEYDPEIKEVKLRLK